MTSQEYVLFAYSLKTPGGKLPAGVNMANVEFFEKHSAELHRLANDTKDDNSEERAGE